MSVVSRTKAFVKLYLIISFIGLFTYFFLAVISFQETNSKRTSNFDDSEYLKRMGSMIKDIYSFDLKYILIWDEVGETLEGLGPFVERGCLNTNCYITRNKTITNLTNFDAIIFNSSAMRTWVKPNLPDHRSQRQKYVFYSMQSARNNPICDSKLDNYFNWTWSYKFSSDIFNSFIEVFDLDDNIVAPNKGIINWEAFVNTKRHNDLIKHKKVKAMALVLRNCSEPENGMYKKLKSLRMYMSRRALDFDIYGCEEIFRCSKRWCMKIIKRNYYFYLVIEKSFEQDYVSDEVLKAYDNELVPVVAGGADLTKFLPHESYIDFSKHNEKSLTDLIESALNNATLYNNYFAWKEKYVIQKVDRLEGLCDLCTLLNSETFKKYSSYSSLREWWYPGNLKATCYPKRY